MSARLVSVAAALRKPADDGRQGFDERPLGQALCRRDPNAHDPWSSVRHGHRAAYSRYGGSMRRRAQRWDGARPGCDADGRRRPHTPRGIAAAMSKQPRKVDARSDADETDIAIPPVTQGRKAEIFREAWCV
ncbi:hypothetical protein [Lysobacter sp. ESA13C]|uniref:hypothetical protein n=1 Tax=Lysobacter sp. ESA13C TaxID=2862676 RepID=UPI001CC0A070|nr:hypothetical protein [Lysobacter sp. ESA13C]